MKKLILLGLAIVLCAFTTQQTQKVIDHAKWQTTQFVMYDGDYVRIPYPNGDVPADIGVCTDVIIRAYRAINIDLQKLIHEDMVSNKTAYNKRYYTKILDTSIDHRRTQNQETFFSRHGTKLAVTNKGSDYKPGDLVFWDMSAGHVGIVVDLKVEGTDRYEVVHNISGGPEMEDCLFRYDISGHYKY